MKTGSPSIFATATTAPDWLGIANSTRHGYTGHEHLDNVNLVHMGGRVYDPVAARFVSADPVIGSLADSQSINPYQGCEHGCVYCFARPTHAFLDLSPGLDFETRIVYKPEAAQLLRKELAAAQAAPAGPASRAR